MKKLLVAEFKLGVFLLLGRDTSELCWRITHGAEQIYNISADSPHFPVLHNKGLSGPLSGQKAACCLNESGTKTRLQTSPRLFVFKVTQGHCVAISMSDKRQSKRGEQSQHVASQRWFIKYEGKKISLSQFFKISCPKVFHRTLCNIQGKEELLEPGSWCIFKLICWLPESFIYFFFNYLLAL